MKARERIERIRKSKSRYEQIALARDILPGTRFDGLLARLYEAVAYLNSNPIPKRHYLKEDGTYDVVGMTADQIRAFGHDFATAAVEGNSTLFREIADAIDQWHAHKKARDARRVGEGKNRMAVVIQKQNTAEVVRHSKHYGPDPDKLREALLLFCLPPSKSFAMRDVIAHLRTLNLVPNDADPSTVRHIRRLCRELNIKISGSPGRPKK